MVTRKRRRREGSEEFEEETGVAEDTRRGSAGDIPTDRGKTQ